jgi:hypothetical protein
LLAPLASQWLCGDVYRVHGTSTHAGLPKRQTRSGLGSVDWRRIAAGRSKAAGNVTPCSAAQGGIVVPRGVEGVLVGCGSQADQIRTKTGT